jgi:hypothetical protein
VIGRIPSSATLAGLMFILLFTTTGCQMAQPIAAGRLIEHQALLDFSGLRDDTVDHSVKVVVAIPETWELLQHRTSLYTHQQWQSPSRNTAIGVAYIRTLLPLSARTVVWFAKNEYRKRDGSGEIVAEWTDEFGRPWFEAVNELYYVRGYAITRGIDAWIIYAGHKVTQPPNPAEINLAARSLETVLPLPLYRIASTE